MLCEEARLAARIHHPNVVPILEIGTSERGYYIVMEYVEGDTLGRLLARSAQSSQRLPIKVGLRVMIDMLAGLEAAHELKDDEGKPLGIVHRDISPQNVLVGVDGSARLSDFGVARATSKLSTTRTGQLKGKLAYMAPEQARAAKDIDRRADIFASGIVLWEVLACRLLFKGDGEADTLNRVLHEPIPPVRSATPTIPAALEAVVAKALERDRAKRYSNAAEFADALERAARVVGALGTHKEVAAHLEAVLGTEMGQQRDAVRAWVARSEPNRQGAGPQTAREEPASITRIQGKGNGSGSSLGNPSGEGTPSAVSSVPSAVISNTPIIAPTPAPAFASIPPPAARRTRVWPWATVVIAAVVTAGGWMRWTRPGGHSAPGSSVGGASPAFTTVSVPTVTLPSLSTASGSTVRPTAPTGSEVSSAPSNSALGTSPSSSVAHPGWHPPPTHPTVAPKNSAAAPVSTQETQAPPAPSATTVPDDISRNPYR